ncbi:hypothetical protein GW17_00053312 [Ensete ventricosum]|nr:hypothetical protein GW17_00053312 [Ensete ventricosum]
MPSASDDLHAEIQKTIPSATNTDDDPSGRLTECVTLIMQDLHIAAVVAKDAADQHSLCSLVELEDKQKADAHITEQISDRSISFQPLLSTGGFDMVKHDEVCSTTVASSSITTDSKDTSGLANNYTSVASLGHPKDGCSTAEAKPSDVGGDKEGGNVSPNLDPGAMANKEKEEISGNSTDAVDVADFVQYSKGGFAI